MNRAFKRHARRLLIALLLPALLCPAALADDQTADTWYFGGTGQETFYEATPLPNGCLLLNGSTQLGRNGQEQLSFSSREKRAWLLCLNPDMSIAWEVIDDAEGTSRYVVPQVLADGRIAVLYYNSPSQVTEAVAIRYFTQDGEPAGEVSLPANAPFELPGDRCAGGYVFSGYQVDTQFADESGINTLPDAGEISVKSLAKRSVLATADGQMICGFFTVEGERHAAVAYVDASGVERWRFSPDEYATGNFGIPCLQKDGSIVFLWSRADPDTRETTAMSLLCLDQDGALLWELPVPTDIGTEFTPVDGGYVFCRTWQEKTYTHARFTLVDPNGQVVEVRDAQPRREEFSGEIMFTWNGEAWFLTNAERSSNRINDRQDELELVDAALIRVNACEVVTE
ncbi:MAG TPA: hypothetical protein IAC11_08195 [Candidatus Limiplasma pullicola]|nr:hypothetical protein [Candidatus Limiplasma pullicola]